jgi:uncharacterized membrane protein YphA (DoxX/SURF4 family)
MKKQLFIEFVIFCIVVLFLYAGGVKLFDYARFANQIGKSPLLGDFAWWLAWLVPATELFVAAMLMVPRLRLPGMYAAFGMMFTFTLYIAAILSSDHKLPCACGGVLNSLGWREHLVFNIFFTALTLAGIALLSSHRPEHNKSMAMR